MDSPGRRIAVVGVSGNGKTTFARRAARAVGVPHIELDALWHGPGWQQIPLEEFRAKVDQLTVRGGWVTDGAYASQVGDITFSRADTIVWLDLPLPLVVQRLIRRAVRDAITQRDLYNGNRQSWRWVFFGREALVPFAISSHFKRRRVWPGELAVFGTEIVRLRSRGEVRRWLEAL